MQAAGSASRGNANPIKADAALPVDDPLSTRSRIPATHLHMETAIEMPRTIPD
jgi:hypothetical protein